MSKLFDNIFANLIDLPKTINYYCLDVRKAVDIKGDKSFDMWVAQYRSTIPNDKSVICKSLGRTREEALDTLFSKNGQIQFIT